MWIDLSPIVLSLKIPAIHVLENNIYTYIYVNKSKKDIDIGLEDGNKSIDH